MLPATRKLAHVGHDVRPSSKPALHMHAGVPEQCHTERMCGQDCLQTGANAAMLQVSQLVGS